MGPYLRTTRLLRLANKPQQPAALRAAAERHSRCAGGVVISRAQMFEPLLAALPSFQDAWSEFEREWQEDGEDRPGYLALGQLADHLIALQVGGEAEQLRAAFAVVERWHTEGEHYVQEAATVGLLEGLQIQCANRSIDPEVFLPFLGPESRRWWNKLERFWEHGERLTDDE